MILDDILARTRLDLAARRANAPLAQLTAAAASAPAPRGFAAGLRRGRDTLGIATISEFKRKSPSAGWMGEAADLPRTVRAYTAGGASALSVLTDGPFFGGALADLATARGACPLPALRKDFIVDRYQIVEARAAGADAILLIVAALDHASLMSLRREAESLELDALVEVHDGDELDRAIAAGADVIGVNNRNLRTLEVDLEASDRLAARMPAHVVAVAESGLRSREDIDRLAARGYHAFLVGEQLMTAADPGAALGALTGRGVSS